MADKTDNRVDAEAMGLASNFDIKDATAIHSDQVRAAAALSLASNELADSVSAEIDRWFGEEIHNSPVSRDVGAINHARVAVDNLKVRLAKLL